MSDIKKTNQPIVSQPHNSVEPKKTLAKRTDKLKKISFFTSIIGRTIDKKICSAGEKQLRKIDEKIDDLKVNIQMSIERGSAPDVELQYKLEVLQAKRALIVELTGLNQEVSGLLGPDRCALLVVAGKVLGDQKTWDAVDTVVYKILDNKNACARIVGKMVYAIAKFLVKLVVSGAKKENYQITGDELGHIQRIVGKHADKIVDTGVTALIKKEIREKDGLSEDKKELLCKIVSTALTKLKGQFTSKRGNTPNSLLVIVSKVLREVNLEDVGKVATNRLPGVMVHLLETDLVKDKIDLTALGTEDVKPLIGHAFGLASQLVNAFVAKNPYYSEVKGSVDNIHKMVDELKVDIGDELVGFLTSKIDPNTTAGIIQTTFLNTAKAQGIKTASDLIDFGLRTVSSFFKNVDSKDMKTWLEKLISNPEMAQKFADFIAVKIRKPVAKKVVNGLIEKLGLDTATAGKLRLKLTDAIKDIDMRTLNPEDAKIQIQEKLEQVAKEVGVAIEMTPEREAIILKVATTFHMVSNGLKQLFTKSEDLTDIAKVVGNLHTFIDDTIITKGLHGQGKYIQDREKSKASHSRLAEALGVLVGAELKKAMQEHDGDLTKFPEYVAEHKMSFTGHAFVNIGSAVIKNVIESAPSTVGFAAQNLFKVFWPIKQ